MSSVHRWSLAALDAAIDELEEQLSGWQLLEQDDTQDPPWKVVHDDERLWRTTKTALHWLYDVTALVEYAEGGKTFTANASADPRGLVALGLVWLRGKAVHRIPGMDLLEDWTVGLMLRVDQVGSAREVPYIERPRWPRYEVLCQQLTQRERKGSRPYQDVVAERDLLTALSTAREYLASRLAV